jgi:biopolymer transport protein ExbB
MFGGLPILEMYTRSFAMWALTAVSIIALTFCIERWRYFHKSRGRIPEFVSRIAEKVKNGQFSECLKDCGERGTPVSRVINEGLKNHTNDETTIREFMTNAISRERTKYENNIGIIGTISHISPLLGLFGTIVGIIRAFHDIAITGSGGSAVVAMGVAEALVTTATGIIIAVPCVIVYNYFARRVATINSELEIARDDFIARLRTYREEQKNAEKKSK